MKHKHSTLFNTVSSAIADNTTLKDLLLLKNTVPNNVIEKLCLQKVYDLLKHHIKHNSIKNTEITLEENVIKLTRFAETIRIRGTFMCPAETINIPETSVYLSFSSINNEIHFQYSEALGDLFDKSLQNLINGIHQEIDTYNVENSLTQLSM